MHFWAEPTNVDLYTRPIQMQSGRQSRECLSAFCVCNYDNLGCLWQTRKLQARFPSQSKHQIHVQVFFLDFIFEAMTCALQMLL